MCDRPVLRVAILLQVYPRESWCAREAVQDLADGPLERFPYPSNCLQHKGREKRLPAAEGGSAFSAPAALGGSRLALAFVEHWVGGSRNEGEKRCPRNLLAPIGW